MALDGLEDAYENAAMGAFAQVTANAYELTREGMDDYTIESLSRAKAAIADGAFAEEITPVTIKTRAGEVVVDTDEQPGKGRPDKIPSLRPALPRTARSRRLPPRRSRTAPPPWSSPAPAWPRPRA
jgi:acetyl-CoA C-acetyltransferase